MATYRTKDFRKVWNARLRKLRKNGIKSGATASRYMKGQTTKEAPYHTGETLSGIRRFMKKNNWVVESKVVGRFKQNLFANQSAPFRTVHFNKKQPFYSVPQTVVYGKQAISASGKSITWTGLPRWWHFSAVRTRDVYRDLIRKNNKQALRVIA